MFRYIKKVRNYLRTKQQLPDDAAKTKYRAHIGASLDKNLAVFKGALGDSTDVIMKEFKFGGCGQLRGALFLIDGLADKEIIDLGILKPLMYDTDIKLKIDGGDSLDIDNISKSFLSSNDIKKQTAVDELLNEILSGNAVLLVDGCKEALSIGTRKWEKRGVDEPQTETVVRGPREGFTETLRVNTSMLRRKIKSPNLRLEAMKIGEQTKTDICIAYIKGIVKPGVVEEVKKRLRKIKTDSVLDSGYIEAYIEDAPFSIFATVGDSERPDTIAGRLLEGRAAIFVDGSPFVLTVPMVFIECFQTAEDYYIRSFYASLLRVLRLLCYFITILAPGLYVALTTFHQELIPTKLLFTMTAGLSGVPFPATLEALIMVLMFDILKEAGIRLPKPVGSAISIVGALVIGQSAVTAGLVGPFMVIVISITAIASFVVPAISDSTSLLRYFFLILSGFIGGIGIIVGVMFVLVYLVSLKSFGVQYLSPITPMSRQGMKDCFVRAPLWAMIKRPWMLSGENNIRRRPRELPNHRMGGNA